MEEKQPLKIAKDDAAVPVPPAQWRTAFAAEVARKAKQLALESDALGLVTLDHFRKAARLAVAEKASLLGKTQDSDQPFRA